MEWLWKCLFKMHSHMNMFFHVVQRCIEWIWRKTAYRYLALQLIGWSPCLWTLGYQIISSTTTSASTCENAKSASWWKKLMNPPLYGVITMKKMEGTNWIQIISKLYVLLCFDTVFYWQFFPLCQNRFYLESLSGPPHYQTFSSLQNMQHWMLVPTEWKLCFR